MKTTVEKLVPTRNYNASPRLTHEFKRTLERDIKRLFVNKEFIDFIKSTLNELPNKDKIPCLHYFKKLAVQVRRTPDPDHYKAFEELYEAEMAQIEDEQKFYDPVKWINAEIEYLLTATEYLTAADVDQRLDVMIAAKQKLSKDLLTADEVRQMLNISKSTLNRYVADGLKRQKRGKFVYFCLQDINDWIRNDAAA